MNLQELAKLLDVKAQGPAEYEIRGVRDIEALSAEQELQDHFVYFIESPAVLKRHPKAGERGVMLTTPELAGGFRQALVAPKGACRLALIGLLQRFDKTPKFEPGVAEARAVHPEARVDPTAAILPGAVVMEGARIGARCVIYPGVVVEPFAEVGEGTVLFPNVVLGHHCVIGKNGIVHGGSVIGADGFGFYDEPGKRHKIPQIGNVVIGDDVEIGASCTVDRATIESTTIGQQTKIDDQVHVAHNCRVGRYVYIAGNTGLAGSVIVEDGVMLSGTVSVKDHVRLAKGTIVMGMSGVAQDTQPKTAYFGIPARPARQMHKMNAALERLPELLARVRELETKVNAAAAAVQPA